MSTLDNALFKYNIKCHIFTNSMFCIILVWIVLAVPYFKAVFFSCVQLVHVGALDTGVHYNMCLL